MRIIIRLIAFYLIPLLAFAADPAAPATGIGQVAQNILEPIEVFSDFMNTGSMLIGGFFIFASLVKYIEHKRSPLMVPISTVVFLFISGIFLILLPLTYILTDNGVPYSLLK